MAALGLLVVGGHRLAFIVLLVVVLAICWPFFEPLASLGADSRLMVPILVVVVVAPLMLGCCGLGLMNLAHSSAN